MKKTLSIVAALFLSIGAWAATGLSYRMVVTATGEVSVASQTSQSLENYAAFIGGSAEIYNGQGSDAKVIQSGCVRLTAKEGYIHVNLNRALAAGDIIRYENGGADQNKMFITTTATRSAGCEINPATDYTVDSKLAGATELYFWYGQSVNSATYMTKLEVTTASQEVQYYDFSGEETTIDDSGITTATTLVNGMAVGGGGDKVAQLSKDGFTKVFNIIGKNADRALTFHVTDPCTIEVWAASTGSTARNIFLSEGSYSQTASTTCANVFGGTVDNAAVHYGTYTYTGLEDDKTMYLSADGGVNIFAVRVIYNKVRPAADMRLLIAGEEKTEYDLVAGQKIDVVTTTTSTVEPKRTKTGESQNVVNISTEDKFTYHIEGRYDKGNYTMIISQAASADFRADSKQITFHVTNESDATIARNTGNISSDSKIWTSTTGGITLADGKEEADANCIRLVSSKHDLLLAKDHNYTIAVPSNKTIQTVRIIGYTAASSDSGKSQAKIRVAGKADSEVLPYDDAAEAGVILYEDVNAKSFTFQPRDYSVKVQIELVLAENYFPITISRGYATFCSADNIFIPSSVPVKAYVATGSTSSEIVLSEIEDGIIKAGTGVILFSEEDGDYELRLAAEAPEMSSILIGTTTRVATPANAYCLNSQAGEFQQYTGQYIPANKAYFVASAGAPARIAIRINQTATDLEVKETADKVQKIFRGNEVIILRGNQMYNLQGQLVK